MDFSNKDFTEIKDLKQILEKIDANPKKYLDEIIDELYQYQPFILSLIMGYQPDLNQSEFEEVAQVYLIIWEFFKGKNNVKKKKLTINRYEEIEKNNIHFFRYLELSDKKDRDFASTNDLQNQASKALLAVIFQRFTSRPILLGMNQDHRAIILVGLKSTIEGLEEITK
ncbi:hypothetical protein [Algoriphagus boritolerans]|uniref:Uncharacterized protein n=1 Tax=Algoriphagus boritolerans DSM 17298 = JCM 18970 TaxID=1120964 RepID=A0A1H6AS38_9BACT|nr:hypothetical protein [Algoriphagus boritolerans]SEG50895.1 hypothetical protein SAMN03080598_04266 [Algoriphagus boritolerans DSM 17298 = JCM 18970]